ncbi:MAG: ribonuclease P protein component, partial [Acidimicrobiia bacterium]|nr:ribonuclease P protein component [Acidimicrobiia bacterium]
MRDKSTFSALSRQGRRATSGPVRMTWLPMAPSAGPERPRLAYAVARRTGGAVTRNLVRRRLRAIATDLAPGLAPGAYLVAYR